MPGCLEAVGIAWEAGDLNVSPRHGIASSALAGRSGSIAAHSQGEWDCPTSSHDTWSTHALPGYRDGLRRQDKTQRDRGASDLHEAQIDWMNGGECRVTEHSSIFDTPLDPYETRALALRTTVLQRIREEGAPEDPLLLLIISSLARIPESAGDRVTVVVTDMVAGLRLSQHERQKTQTSVAGVALAFDPEIQQFKDFFLEAAQYGAPRDSRAAWRAYLQGLIQLFENGTKG